MLSNLKTILGRWPLINTITREAATQSSGTWPGSPEVELSRLCRWSVTSLIGSILIWLYFCDHFDQTQIYIALIQSNENLTCWLVTTLPRIILSWAIKIWSSVIFLIKVLKILLYFCQKVITLIPSMKIWRYWEIFAKPAAQKGHYGPHEVTWLIWIWISLWVGFKSWILL